MTLSLACKVKSAISQGDTVGAACAKWGLPYQAVYRLARGETWKEAKPKGNILDASNRGAPGRTRTLSLWKQYLVWKRRRIKRESTISIAKRYDLSKPSIRRLVREFELMLAVRVSQVHLTSGSYGLIMKRYELSQDDCETLDSISQATLLSPRLRSVALKDFPKLEKKIAKGGKG